MEKVEIFQKTQKRAASKGELTQLKIIETAIACFGRMGIESASMNEIAKQAGLSRAIVTHYYPQKNDLISAVFKYVAETGQTITADRLSNTVGPKEILRAYIDATFEWVDKYPDQMKFWIAIVHKASYDPDWQKLHSLIRLSGFNRMTAVIEAGCRDNTFRSADIPRDARILHDLLSAETLLHATEPKKEGVPQPRDLVNECCERILDFSW